VIARLIAVFAAGLVFAVGLALAGMTQADKVIGFLDVTGAWDPSLALVMAGAISVYLVGLWWHRRMRAPLLAPAFCQPGQTRVTARLVAGAAIFGVGWGLVGLCPGPAIASLGAGTTTAALFTAAMLAGMVAVRLMPRLRRIATAPEKPDGQPDPDATAPRC
jgi:uncharacterized membrane protein YedE/YeeE